MTNIIHVPWKLHAPHPRTMNLLGDRTPCWNADKQETKIESLYDFNVESIDTLNCKFKTYTQSIQK